MRRRAYFQESSRSYDFIHISGAGCQGGGGAARGPRVRKVPAPGPPRPPAPARGPATAVQGAQTPMWSPFVKVWCRSLALAFAPSPPLLSLRSTFAPSQPFNNCTIIPSRTISCPHTFLMPSRAMQTPPTMSRRRTRKSRTAATTVSTFPTTRRPTSARGADEAVAVLAPDGDQPFSVLATLA